MNSEETKTLVGHINAGVIEIKRRINVNTCIFSLTLFVAVLTAYVTWRHDKALDKLAVLAVDNYKKILEFRAKQDAQDSLIVNYINDTVTAINKLARDNPKMIVPKAPVMRFPNVPPPTAGEMERPWVPPPLATPSETPREPVAKRGTGRAREHNRLKKKLVPSPTPWWRFWKQTR